MTLENFDLVISRNATQITHVLKSSKTLEVIIRLFLLWFRPFGVFVRKIHFSGSRYFSGGSHEFDRLPDET